MKKSLLIVSLIFFLLPSFVVAQDTTVTTSNASVKVRVKNSINTDRPVREDIREKIEAKREERQIKLTAIRKERIRNFFGKTVTRVEALIERLDNLIARLETRIAKINEEVDGVDTIQASDDIAEAKIALVAASSKLSTMSSSLEEVLSSDDPKDAFVETRTLLNEIRTDLKKVHTLLVHSIGELRGLRVGDTRTGDTTNEE